MYLRGGRRVHFWTMSVFKQHVFFNLHMHPQAIGDTYVKDEFKRHKAVTEQSQKAAFMEAWAKYCIQLTNQLGKRGVHTAKPLGLAPANSFC